MVQIYAKDVAAVTSYDWEIGVAGLSSPLQSSTMPNGDVCTCLVPVMMVPGKWADDDEREIQSTLFT